MKTKRFDFNFKPLQINVSMVVEGGVSDSQNYDADTDTYTPDYTIDASNLIVQPNIGRLDKDEVLTPGLINQDLTNVVWYEVNKGAATTVIRQRVFKSIAVSFQFSPKSTSSLK